MGCLLVTRSRTSSALALIVGAALAASACASARSSSSTSGSPPAIGTGSQLRIGAVAAAGLPMGPKKLFVDTTGALFAAALDSETRHVSISTVDLASKTAEPLYVSPQRATDWNGASFLSSGQFLDVGWGRHVLRIDRSTSAAQDLVLPATVHGEGPAGVVGLAPDGSSGLLIAVNGVSDLVQLAPTTKTWGRSTSGLVGVSGGVLTRGPSGDVVEVGSPASGSGTDQMISVVHDGKVVSTGATPATSVVASDNNGGVATLTPTTVDLIPTTATQQSYPLSSMTGSVLPLAVAFTDRAVWTMRMGTSNATIRIDRVSLPSGDTTSSDFPVISIAGGRKGLVDQKASSVTAVDPMITSLVAAPDGSAYMATLCGERQDGQSCAYSSLYQFQ